MSGMAPPGSARLLQAGTSRVGCRLAVGGRGNHCTLCSGDPCCSAEDAERTSVHYLRKQARQLENELDLKLVSFSKLCTSYSHSSARDGRRDRYSSDTTPLLNGSSQDRMFETMAIEIEQLLARLTGINDKMAEYTNSAGVPSLNAALMHTLQRHRDILQDYTHEFHKTKANFMAIRERENLMGSVRKDIESYKSGSGVNNRRTELFLKEHEHLRNSDRLIEETISIAMATKENMTSQRGMLKSIQSKMNTLASILFESWKVVALTGAQVCVCFPLTPPPQQVAVVSGNGGHR
ncbi:PREDICTED: Golgi SNAP receptor complex member 1 isoform X3 [Miniopterus natalensis]|uniref:Golgi SNAP receptor complex member 1 isoform X3 n=1 Tax=Miniopterus natalensis TaxID=291302 RepID=UPI0007A6D2CC|nr:PREDICTED: Golgi SNAP receptor complex member 1 isoform X3 [Miniopterus natalensis]